MKEKNERPIGIGGLLCAKTASAMTCFGRWSVILFLVVTGFLSLVFTVHIADYAESSFTYDLSSWASVTLICAFCVLLFAANAFKKLADALSRRLLFSIVLTCSFAVCIAWVFLADAPPGFDSKDLLDAASFLAGNEDASYLWTSEGCYMERFPFQGLFAFVLYLCYLAAGEHAALLYQIVNCICVPVIFYYAIRLSEEFSSNSGYVRLLAALLCLFFSPLVLYCTFVYANTLSLSFCMAAFFFQVKAFKSGNILLHIGSFFLVVVGVLFKSSMLLVLVAMSFVEVVAALRTRRFPLFFVLAGSLVFYLVANSFIARGLEHMTGADLDNGVPSSAWVVMGLGADDEDPTTDRAGWYSAYVWEEFAPDYTEAEYSERSAELIADRLGYFMSDPLFAAEFFAKKYIYEWCEPTYEAIQASNWAVSEFGGTPMAERDLSDVASSMYYGKLNFLTITGADALQLLLLLGALCCCGSRKGAGFDFYAPVLYAAGGALFYLAWEAKSQYIMPFYICLIPYAAVGLSLLCSRMGKRR